MNSIDKVKSISVWIFIIPFLSVNTCLLIVTNFHQILEPGVPIFPTFPFLKGLNKINSSKPPNSPHNKTANKQERAKFIPKGENLSKKSTL